MRKSFPFTPPSATNRTFPNIFALNVSKVSILGLLVEDLPTIMWSLLSTNLCRRYISATNAIGKCHGIDPPHQHTKGIYLSIDLGSESNEQ